MQHMLTPYSRGIEPFAWWENAFTNEQLDWLQQKAKEAVQDAQVGGGVGGKFDDEIRRSELNWLDKNEESFWVFDTLAHVAASLNARYFGFELTGFGEHIQLTNYHEARQGTYVWHQDFGSSGPSRKLSMVVQLSDPSEYEGGGFEFAECQTPDASSRLKGTVLVFPSYLQHRVLPVTSGTRKSLVAWFEGPRWK